MNEVSNNMINANLNAMNLMQAGVMEELLELAEQILNAGEEPVANAGANVYGEEFINGIKDLINDQQGIPQAKKDEIMNALDGALEVSKVDTTEEAMSVIDMLRDQIQDMAKEDVKETGEAVGEGSTAEGSQGAGGAGGTGGKGAGNWLVALAKAMGAIAGNHLEKMIDAQERIGKLEGEGGDNKSKAKEMAELTAELQAHTQMFKMMQEAMTTVIKSVGEALHGTARKQ